MEQNKRLYKIAILGAESTGKTTLCEQLAKHYHTIWVPEYAREYIAALQLPYVLEDLEIIAKNQLQKEAELCLIANKYLFVDTELIIMKVWALQKFQTLPNYISTQLSLQQYDLYLVLENDLPWVYDPLRENPDKRDALLSLYLQELEGLNANYYRISGFGEARLQNAIEQIEKQGFH